MGTNFYAVLPVKKRTTNKLRELADKLDAGQNVDIEGEMYDINQDLKCHEVHLGKRSCGWAFLWDANELKYYEPSLESIKKFIDDNNAKIQDEYGVEFTWDQFINDEIKHCLHPSETPITTVDSLEKIGYDKDRIKYIKENYFNKNLPYYQYCTSRSYFEMNPTELRWVDSYTNYNNNLIKYAKGYMIDCNYSDFITKDGLRFALFTDFS